MCQVLFTNINSFNHTYSLSGIIVIILAFYVFNGINNRKGKQTKIEQYAFTHIFSSLP